MWLALRIWWNHAALNLGAGLECLYHAVRPPQLDHTPEQLATLTRGGVVGHFLEGLGLWRQAEHLVTVEGLAPAVVAEMTGLAPAAVARAGFVAPSSSLAAYRAQVRAQKVATLDAISHTSDAHARVALIHAWKVLEEADRELSRARGWQDWVHGLMGVVGVFG